MKIKKIGLAVEDESDFETVRILINRVILKEWIGFKKTLWNGCGRLHRKATDFARTLVSRWCNLIIIVHDRDDNDLDKLREELQASLDKAYHTNFVCIPIEEIEAWFLSDTNALKVVFGLTKEPKIPWSVENINSPKEKLGECVHSCSGGSKIYINTKHNPLIAARIDINKIYNKCSSFKEFFDFLRAQKY